MSSYKDNRPLRELSKIIKKYSSPCVISSKKEKIKPGTENSLWIYRELKKIVPNLSLAYVENNKFRRSILMTNERRFIEPDLIFKFNYHIAPSFEKNALVINTKAATSITKNKYRTIKAIKKHFPEIKIPKTFLIKNYKKLRSLLKRKRSVFEKGFVIKPLKGSLARHVHVFSEYEKPKIEDFISNEEELLEERIIPKLHHHFYWNVRVFIVDGKFAGAVIGESHSKITNLHSHVIRTLKTPKRLIRKLISPSLKAVKAIDIEAEKIKS